MSDSERIPEGLPEPQAVISRDLERRDYEWLVDRREAIVGELSDPLPDDEHYDSRMERVIGKPDFLPVSFLSLGSNRSKAICRIEIFQNGNWRAWGTGFLIAPNVIMTNNHVLEYPSWANVARTLFRDELDNNGNQLQPEIFKLDPDQLFITNNELDFTICAVHGRPGDTFGFIELNREPHKISRHERVSVVQHPQGRPKEVSLHDNRVERVKSTVLLYTTDTEPGSSGSGVFTNSWELIALHHAGGEKGPNGKWANNEGIRISAILRHLEDLAHRGNSEQARTVLAHVAGRNPYEGIFGLHGRRPSVGEDYSAEERVVYDYHGSDAFLDVGFWNIEHFNNHSSISRRRKVARFIEHLSLDLLGLVEVEEDAVAWMVGELQRRGFQYDFVMQDAPGGQDLAIVYDTTTIELEKQNWSDDWVEKLRAKVDGTNKRKWHRLPLLARAKTVGPRAIGNDPFDFLVSVIHAKATTWRDEPGIPQRVRKASAEVLADALAAKMNELDEQDVIVGGDFNAKLEEQSFAALDEEMRAVALTTEDATGDDPDAYTYLGSHKGLIDHIYITPSTNKHYDPGSISVTRADVNMPDFRDLSDHAPIISRFTFRGEDGGGDVVDVGEVFEVSVPEEARRILLTRE